MIDDMSLPSSSWISSTPSTNGDHRTAIIGIIEERVEVDPCVVSATSVGWGNKSSSGVK